MRPLPLSAVRFAIRTTAYLLPTCTPRWAPASRTLATMVLLLAPRTAVWKVGLIVKLIFGALIPLSPAPTSAKAASSGVDATRNTDDPVPAVVPAAFTT